MNDDLVRELDRLTTEAHRPELADIDLAATEDVVIAMNRENAHAVEVVLAAGPAIAAAIDAIVARMRRGGRLVYVGAGTPGRIGVLDASEIPPTFATSPDLVMALIAGGPAAIVDAVEGAEDDEEGAIPQLAALGVGPLDSVVGLSASGRTRYAVGALRGARERGALTVAVAGNHDSALAAVADLAIEVVVGPEFLVGSTRLKAGTAQKLVLNTISTVAMMRLGKTYGNLMVNLRATNAKLTARARRIVVLATGCDQDRADEALYEADGEVPTAIVMVARDVDAVTARSRLARAEGHVREALTDD